MEPTQHTGASASDQDLNAQPTVASAETSGASASYTSHSTDQQSSDGKSWTETANLQQAVDQLPQGVRDFFTNSWQQAGKTWEQVSKQVAKLSTTQKVAGVAALAGIGYLATRSGKKSAKPAGRYKSSPSTGPSYRRHEQNYYSGSGYASSGEYQSAGSRPNASRRMDMGPGHWNSGSGFDRQNESRAGGSYSAGSASSSGYATGNQGSSTYRGSLGNDSSSSSNADSDYDNGI